MQSKHDGAEQFVRLACLQTNELEGVFDLDGDSTMKLTQYGLYATSIEGISQTSRQKKMAKILEILMSDASTKLRMNVFKKNLPLPELSKNS